MATARPCLAPLSRTCRHFPPATRLFSTSLPTQGRGKFKPRMVSKKPKEMPKVKPFVKKSAVKKKKVSTTFLQPDLSKQEQFSLLDAMRIIRAWEVGQKPASVKYELAVRLKSLKNGPVVRNRIRLPHPVKTDFKVCVICPPNSKHAKAAKAAGAVLVGEDEVFDAVKSGKIEFDRCLCQSDSVAKLNKSGLGRILGPKGLMPNPKTGTIVSDPVKTMKDMAGAMEYREKMGVVRVAIGQLGFTPQEMSKNVKAFIESVKTDMVNISDKITKDVAEVVLSSTNGPGLPLNGVFSGKTTTITAEELSGRV